jgi:hypothetical protein
MEPACQQLVELAARCQAQGWSAAVERDFDDFENYLAIQLERLEDMGPVGGKQETSNALMIQALEGLIEITGQVRESAESGAGKSSDAAELEQKLRGVNDFFAQAREVHGGML